MSEIVNINKDAISDKLSNKISEVVSIERKKYLSGEVGMSKAEIFRRHLVEFETRFKLYVGDENYLDEIVLILDDIGVKTNKNEVAMLLSKTAKEIGFDRKTKKLKKVKL